MPDAHSFCEVVRPHIDEGVIYTPYRDAKSQYFEDEEIEFKAYFSLLQ
jgi:hypothetical protein